MKLNLLISNTETDAFNSLMLFLKKVRTQNSKSIVIVPDKFSLSAEKQMFETLNETSIFDIDVYSFARLANKVCKNFKDNEKTLSKTSGVMLVNKIVLENYKNFSCFGKAKKLKGFSEIMFDTISQLKSCNITPGEFKSSIKEEENSSLKVKAEDIAFIYEKYENYLKNNYIDASNKLTILANDIPFNERLKDADIFIGMFDSFTPQMLDIIKSLIKTCKSVNVGIVANTKQNNANIYTNECLYSLQQVARECKIKEEITNSTEKLQQPFDFISKNYYGYKINELALTLEEEKRLNLLEFSGIKQEASFIASEIKRLVFTKGYRYKDFNIAIANLESNKEEIKSVFEKYELPFFVDENILFTEHIFSKFIFASLDVLRKHFELSDVIALSKNYFLKINKEQAGFFEDYLRKYYVTGRCIFNKFNIGEKYEQFETVESIRQEFYANIKTLNEEVSGAKTAQEFVVALKNYFEKLQIKQQLEELSNMYLENGNIKWQKITNQVFDKIDNLLNEIVEVMGDEKISFNDFYHILESGILSLNISIVPVSVDSVFVADADSGMFEKKKVMYIANASQNNAPVIKSDVGIILDSDIEKINTKNKIEPTIKIVNRRNKFKLFNLTLKATDYLQVSYCNCNAKGEAQRPSVAISNLAEMFYVQNNGVKTGLKIIKTDEMFYDLAGTEKQQALYKAFECSNDAVAEKMFFESIRQWKDGITPDNKEMLTSIYYYLLDKYGIKEIDSKIALLDYKNNPDNIKNARELFFEKDKTKISQLQTYFACPFKHFLQYGIKAKEKEVSEIRALDVGNILHLVSELFVREYKTKNIAEEMLENVSEKIICKILQKDEYASIVKNKRNANLVTSLKLESKNLCKAIFNQLKNSSFDIKWAEYKFNTEELLGLKLKMKNGKDLSFTGIADRVDVFNNNFTIIDYKTGGNSSKFSFDDVYMGKKIQLLIYSRAIEKILNSKPAGVFYFPIRNNFTDTSTKPEVDIYERYKLSGPYLQNNMVLKAMDNKLTAENLKSNVLEVDFKKAKSNDFSDCEMTSHSLKRSLLAEEFDYIQSYATKIAQIAGNEIAEGFVKPLPLEDSVGFSTCNYCKYKSVCKFEKALGNVYRKPVSATKDKICEVVKNA